MIIFISLILSLAAMAISMGAYETLIDRGDVEESARKSWRVQAVVWGFVSILIAFMGGRYG